MSELLLTDKLKRLGTETAFEVLARAAELERGGKSIINLGIGQPDFKTPEHVVDAAARAMHDGHHGYTPAPGILELREAVAEDIALRRHQSINPDNIVIMPGGKPTMFFAILMFGDEGREILYPDPGFPIYRSMIEFTGAKAVPIPLLEQNDFSFDADSVLDSINENTSLVILNSPANPTGGAVAPDQFEKLLAGLAEKPHVAVMSDEIYSRIVYDDMPHQTMLGREELAGRLIMLDGWSKTYAMTGWRLGYSVWPDSLIESVTRLAVNCHSCVNAPTQFAGIAALQGPQDAVTEMVEAFDSRRRKIVEGLNQLPGVSCVMPRGAFYAFPNIKGTGLSARDIQHDLLEKQGIATVSGTSFGQYGEGYLRLSYAASLANIDEAINRMRPYLEQITAS